MRVAASEEALVGGARVSGEREGAKLMRFGAVYASGLCISVSERDRMCM